MDRDDTHVFAQRPPASALLCIDSEDRYQSLESRYFNAPSNPGNDFRIQKGQPLLYGIFHRVGMVQLQMQYRIPTVVAGVNNQFVIYDTGGNNYYQVTLPEGYYSADNLGFVVKTLVLSLPGNPFPAFDCSYNIVTGGLSMACATVPFALVNVYNPGPFTDAQQQVWSRTLVTLGASQDNTTGSNTQFLGSPQLLFTRYIDITSSRLAKFQRVKDSDTLLTNKSNHVWRVFMTAPNTRVDPVATPGPFDICIDPNTPKHSMWSIDEAVYELDFQLYDEFGQLIPWTPTYNTEFQMSLLASET